MHLKNCIINKLKENAKKLTNGAVKLLIFLGKYCDDAGIVTGVYYKEFCKLTGMCTQSFYNAKRKLIELGFVSCQKEHERDIDFLIMENSIVLGEERKEGYVPFDTNFFEDCAIWNLTDNALILALQFLKNSGANKKIKATNNDTVKAGSFRKNWKDFLGEYMQSFDICEVQLKSYLKALKNFFSIGIKEKIFFATPLIEKVKKYRSAAITSVEKKLSLRVADTLLKRKGLFLKKKTKLQSVKNDVCELILQYKSYAIAELGEHRGKDASSTQFSEIFHVATTALDFTLRAEDKAGWEEFIAKNVKFLHKNIRRVLGLEKQV